MPSDKFELSDTSSGSKEREGERDRERERNGSKSKTNAGQTKTKDVSHVPCKFFRLNQCTAGASCPFSHNLAEPGHQKDTCQWFLKGNCKFGHKCALAHILPGQPMSMDRKNKKAAQQAAAAGTGGATGANATAPSNRGSEKRKTGGAREESLRIGIGRGLGRGSVPISISKATLSPSAPAPPLSDIDFPLGLPDDFTQPVQTTAKQPESQKDVDADPMPTNLPTLAEVVVTPPRVETTKQPGNTPPQQDTPTEESKLPVSKPSASRGFARQNGSTDFGFGPIGSPPRSSPAHTPTSQPIPQSIHQINEFSPSVSPKASGLMGNPMPASSPFSKNAFMSYSLDLDTSASTQIRASAGTRPPAITGAMSVGGMAGWNISGPSLGGMVEEDDFEEFLPSSLNELLTDEEKKRRLSRTGGQRPVLETHHRYSRSVPAVNLMDGVKGIWSDNNGDLQSNAGLNPSFLGTSNVSTGFLPRRPAVSTRTFTEAPPTLTASSMHLNNFSSSGSPLTTGFISPPLPNIFSSHRTNTLAQPQSVTGPFDLPQPPRPIPAANQELFSGNPLSPTVRALQEHAPGQSLPQGLAAGLSRLHIRPPASIGTGASPHLPGLSASPGTRLMGGSSFTSNNEYTGLTGLSQATSPNPALGSLDPRSNNIPSRRQWPSLSASTKSPLTSGVIPNDDGLFEMDEDK